MPLALPRITQEVVIRNKNSDLEETENPVITKRMKDKDSKQDMNEELRLSSENKLTTLWAKLKKR